MLIARLSAATVRPVEGAPWPDMVASPELKCTEDDAVLRFPAAEASGRGTIENRFQGVLTLSLGWPNDEALNGHRLWGTGLNYHAIQEVIGSDLIEELERRNAVHRLHRSGAFRDRRHIIVTFKDATFECVCMTMELSHSHKQQPTS